MGEAGLGERGASLSITDNALLSDPPPGFFYYFFPRKCICLVYFYIRNSYNVPK